MNFILFDRSTYDSLYNCSMFTPEKWETYRKPNIVIGSIYILLGLIYQTAYLPFLIVMRRPEFIRHSAYKLMFYLGIVDVLATLDGGVLCGIIYVRGDIFCTNPNFVYIVSCFPAAIWGAACVTGLLLVVTRVLDLISPYYSNIVFGGNKTYFWLIPPTLYAIYTFFFLKAFLFNSIEGALFLSPYAGVDEIKVDINQYQNMIMVVNNAIIVVAYPALYTVMCIVLVIKTKKSGTAQISLLQKQMILQSLIICFLLMVTAIVYMYMQYFETPHFLMTLAHFTWQASHGGAVFAYIFINRSMRRAMIELIRNPFGKKDNSKASNLFTIKTHLSHVKSSPN